jgi:Protein of unknown function (DUF2865)
MARAMEASLIARARKAFRTHVIATLVATLTATAVIVPTVPASAQSLFDFLFRGQRRSAPPPSANAYADPYPGYERERQSSSGGYAAYCVRLCDGRYFPIQRTGASNPAHLCNSFCPASPTRVFSGGGIDHAVATDGTRYASLRTAFAYRERVVENCTCNGRDPYGLVTLNAGEDPTLRQGDIIATNEGFVAVNGIGRRQAEFTPIESYPGLPQESRQRLVETRIVPSSATPVPPDAPRDSTGTAQDHRGRRVQLDR